MDSLRGDDNKVKFTRLKCVSCRLKLGVGVVSFLGRLDVIKPIYTGEGEGSLSTPQDFSGYTHVRSEDLQFEATTASREP